MQSTILEDNKTYIILDEIENDGKIFVYLVEENNDKNFIIRKRIQENNKEFFVGLDDEKEFKTALDLYIEKNA